MKSFFSAALFLLTATIATAQPQQISLPENPPAERTIELEEVWRIGGEDDEDILLGMVPSGVMDAEGNIFLLDSQLSQVLLISPDGELLDTLGREGEGPGEMSRPTGIFLNNEQQIGIAQGFPGKVILLNRDGNPGGSIAVNQDTDDGGFAYVGAVAKRGEHLVLLHGKSAFDMKTANINTRTVLTSVDSEGNQLALFAEQSQVRDMNKQVFDEEADFSELRTWTLGPDAVYTVPFRDQYLINSRSMDGELQRVISRPFSPRQRKEEDKEELTAGMGLIINGQKIEMEKHILDNDQAILSMDVSDDGRLFVQNCYQAAKLWPEGTAKKYDIISPEGEFTEELTLMFPGFDTKEDALAFLDGEYFLYLKGFQGAVKSLRSAFLPDGSEEDETEDIAPLEVILCRIPG